VPQVSCCCISFQLQCCQLMAVVVFLNKTARSIEASVQETGHLVTAACCAVVSAVLSLCLLAWWLDRQQGP
jgi:hypothetical protein